MLELSFDETPVPELIQEHHYSSFDARGANTNSRVAHRRDGGRPSRPRARWRSESHSHGRTLGPEEINELLAQDGTWNPDPTNPAFLYAVVDEPSAVELQSKRPREADPHEPRE